MHNLIDRLRAADLVVGFNILNFDYHVLMGYTVLDLAHTAADGRPDARHGSQKLGHRLGLDAIAQATLGVQKTAASLDAIRWWREGRIAEIAEYCCFDVKVTRLVHEHGCRHKELFFSRSFRPPAARRSRLGAPRRLGGSAAQSGDCQLCPESKGSLDPVPNETSTSERDTVIDHVTAAILVALHRLSYGRANRSRG